jgi:hypothetical protein
MSKVSEISDAEGSVDERFRTAVAFIQSNPKGGTPSNAQRLQYYAHFKQARVCVPLPSLPSSFFPSSLLLLLFVVVFSLVLSNVACSPDLYLPHLSLELSLE